MFTKESLGNNLTVLFSFTKVWLTLWGWFKTCPACVSFSNTILFSDLSNKIGDYNFTKLLIGPKAINTTGSYSVYVYMMFVFLLMGSYMISVMFTAFEFKTNFLRGQ